MFRIEPRGEGAGPRNPDTPLSPRERSVGRMTTTPTPASVTWFELGATDLEGTKRFYGELFGWTFAPDPDADGYTVITAGPDGLTNGGIAELGSDRPVHATVGIQVADVAASCARAEELGAKTVAGPMGDPATTVTFAYVQDPEGRFIELWCPPPAAA